MENDAETLAVKVAEALIVKKGQKTRILSLRGLSIIADYFVLTSGTSRPHVQALFEAACDVFLATGIRPRIEGAEARRWVLVDGGNVVVHIFHEEEREYYGLERIWSDAPEVVFPASGVPERPVSDSVHVGRHESRG